MQILKYLLHEATKYTNNNEFSPTRPRVITKVIPCEHLAGSRYVLCILRTLAINYNIVVLKRYRKTRNPQCKEVQCSALSCIYAQTHTS